MRLVEADKTIGHIKTRLLETALNNCDVVCDASYIYTDCADNRIETWVDEMPTVDAVEVVRCKDCFYCRKYNEMWRFPKRDVSICIRLYDGDGEEVSAEDYCSWGERREDDTN